MKSWNYQINMTMYEQLQKFFFAFNKHWKNTYPHVFQTQDLLERIQKHMLAPTLQPNQVDVEEIQKQLAKALISTPKLKKNGIMIIGPPGIGKTAFMKFYAKKHYKILINANCCELISTFKNQTIDVIDILFQMANFEKDALLFFDEIDILMNDQNYFQNMSKQTINYYDSIRNSLLKNLTRKDFITPVIYSTNKPWKINNKEFLSTINCSILIQVSSFEKRKQLIKVVLQDSKSQNVDISAIDVDDIAQKTNNYLNSDIYVLIRQILMQPIRQMVQKGASIEQIQQEKLKITKQNIQKAYQKIKPSMLVQQITQYKEWKQKFQHQNL